MTQGKVTVNNKPPENGGGNADVQSSTVAPSAPPSYEEATAGDVKKAGFLNTSSTVTPYPNWTQEDTGSSPGYGSAAYSGDTEMLTSMSWEDDRVRRSFIRKVYSILSLQLLVTVAIVALFTFCDPVKEYVQDNPGWYWASYAVFFTTYLVLACCNGPRRYFPWNLILLTIFTLSMAYVTGMIASYYDTKSVILCLGITALVCLAVTLFSFQTKLHLLLLLRGHSLMSLTSVGGRARSSTGAQRWRQPAAQTNHMLFFEMHPNQSTAPVTTPGFYQDARVDFTSCHGLLFTLVMVLLFSGLFLVVLIPFQYMPWLHVIYAVLGAIVFTLFLAFDTQMLIGNRRNALSPEEYIFGALNIYLDIIYIFTFLLQLFGTSQN
ncbi:protein lifeguard 2 isoform X1 [Engystomops pustulosus]|uniref:protein lifeguard 2 isoform X1 n=1 Tax=Engystomops pustulosus TaxID=76066 RepID=UPI003AFB0CD1